MQKHISLRGLNYSSNNHLSTDGDLHVAINLINESGSLTPIGLPDSVATLEDGAVAVFAHVSSEFTNYIIYKDKKLYSTTDFTQYTEIEGCELDIEPVITAIKNTLIISADVLRYAYYSEEGYKYLGTKPPIPKIMFALDGEFMKSDVFNMNNRTFINEYVSDKNNFNLEDIAGENDSDRSEIDNFVSYLTNSVLAQTNKFVNEKGTKENRFIFPFLLRFAYRMYDGTYAMHSYPILMTPFSDVIPKTVITRFETEEGGDINDKASTEYKLSIQVYAMVCQLKYKMLGYFDEYAQEDTILGSWKDLIQSLDIFVSAPQYTYDTNGKVYGWSSYPSARYNIDMNGESLSKHLNYRPGYASTENHSNYSKRSFKQLFSYTYSPSDFNSEITDLTTTSGFTIPTKVMTLPQKDVAISDESLFYKISSIKIGDLITNESFTEVDIDDNTLTNLQVQQRLDDDFKSHTTFGAGTAYAYNSRINIGNITEHIYNGMPIGMQCAYLDKSTPSSTMRMFVYLKKDGKEFIVESPKTEDIDYTPYYIYYPDTDAYKVIIDIDGEITSEIKLKPHNLLNGSYYFNNFGFSAATALTPTATKNNVVQHPNSIYTSYPNNPFVFPPMLMNTVGVGAINQLTSATLALSEGQFGQFPLHAFTTEGVWALQVTADGGYSSIQPISRDIAIGDVLQLDQSLAFATDKGLALMAGSNVSIISDSISNFIFPTFKMIENIMSAANCNLHIPSGSFLDYIVNSKLSYDYVNQLVYICSSDKEYSYVYSLRSGLWCTSTITYDRILASYPTMLFCGKNKIYKFLNRLDSEPTEMQLAITRGLTLDSPDGYKSIRDIFTRGDLYGAEPYTVLYGSNDAITYIPIATNKGKNIHLLGSPYRYFSILSVGSLDIRDSLNGYDVEFDNKIANKLR